jgi:hypothetical protein
LAIAKKVSEEQYILQRNLAKMSESIKQPSSEIIDHRAVSALHEMTAVALEAPNLNSQDIVFKVESPSKNGVCLVVHSTQDSEGKAKWIVSYDDGNIHAAAFKRYGIVHEDGSYNPANIFFDPENEDFEQKPCTAECAGAAITEYFAEGNFEIRQPVLDHVNFVHNPKDIIAYLSLRNTVVDPREKVIAPDLVA